MLGFLLQLVLLIHRLSAGVEFLGTVTSYQPENTDSDGSVTVVLRSKLSSQHCTSMNWECLTGSCGNQTAVTVNTVSEDEGEGWCQTESISSRLVNGDISFQLLLMGGNWTSSIHNGRLPFRAVTLVDLRKRSDTKRANNSPQTTVLPTVRVPSNCRRDFNLLNFDPDQDEVRCRFKNQPPSVLSLSPSCTLSFEPSSSDEGVFAVQLLMEDFPRQNITLMQTNGSTELKTTRDAISRIPVQFVVKVDPAVPSCSEGLHLPRFLPPTPANRAQLIANISQLLEINITAAVNTSKISKLLFSGPHNVTVVADSVQNKSGQFVLRWTPSESDAAATHPICFVVKAAHNGSSFYSDLRCVIVRVESVTTTSASNATPAFIPPSTNHSISPLVITSTSPPITNSTSPLPTTRLTTTPATNATNHSISPPPTTSIHPSLTASTSPPPTIKPTTTPTATTTTATTAFIPPPTAAPISPLTITTTPAANTTIPSTSPPPTTSTHPSPTAPIGPPLPTSPTTPEENTTIPPTSPPPTAPNSPPLPTTNTPPAYVIGLRVKVSSLLHQSQIDTDAVLDQVKAVLASEGLQLDVALLSISLRLDAGTTAPPAAET